MKTSGIIEVFRNWGFVRLNKDIGQLYRRLFLYDFGIKLEAPSQGEHITIFSPEDKLYLRPQKIFLDKLEVCVIIDPSAIWHNGNAIWLNVYSADIDLIRKQYLLNDTTLGLHFCIGYLGIQDDSLSWFSD